MKTDLWRYLAVSKISGPLGVQFDTILHPLSVLILLHTYEAYEVMSACFLLLRVMAIYSNLAKRIGTEPNLWLIYKDAVTFILLILM